MSHAYTKPRSPNLNGKVERSHLTEQLEFYQLLECTDDVDLAEKLATWEEFYNVYRPHTWPEGADSVRGPQKEVGIVKVSTEVVQVTIGTRAKPNG